MKRISPKLAAWGVAATVCLGSGLSYAKLTKNNVRSRPMLVVDVSDDLYDFFGFADVSTAGVGLDACHEDFGEEQFLEFVNADLKGEDYALVFVKPELGPSCRLSELPGAVSLIRVMGHCPNEETFELTSFDGTTASPEIGQTFIVGDPVIVPEGCHDVLTHSVVFEFKPLESESIDLPHTQWP